MTSSEFGYAIRKDITDKIAYLLLASSLMKKMAFEENVKKTKAFLVVRPFALGKLRRSCSVKKRKMNGASQEKLKRIT